MATGYYPPAGFHFKVEFSISSDENDTRFQSVAGLTIEYETESFKEGGENRFEHVLPIRTKYPDLVLKRGFLTKDSKVFEWCMKAFHEREFKLTNIIVKLLNEEHEPLKSWKIVGAYPKKWTVSDLNAESNTIVVESFELRYKYFTVG